MSRQRCFFAALGCWALAVLTVHGERTEIDLDGGPDGHGRHRAPHRQQLLQPDGQAHLEIAELAVGRANATASSEGADDLTPACKAVAQVDAKDGNQHGTCLGRIQWVANNKRISMQKAQEEIGIDFSKACGPCWPYPKFKQTGDATVSRKRGIAINNNKLSETALKNLAHVVSWGATWEANPGEGGPDIAMWDKYGIRFMPMVFNRDAVGRIEHTGVPKGAYALLGFNEPNFREQANMSPEEAAELWPRVQQIAAKAGISKIVSPAMGLSQTNDPVRWLQRFFALCSSCKVDAIAIHLYVCYGRWLKLKLDAFRRFKKPIWITEMACSDAGSRERLPVDGQIAYLDEAVPVLEHDPDVEMYAWFSLFKDQWTHPTVAGENGDAGLVRKEGPLSKLGEHYGALAAVSPMESPKAPGGNANEDAADSKNAEGGSGTGDSSGEPAQEKASHRPCASSLAATHTPCASSVAATALSQERGSSSSRGGAESSHNRSAVGRDFCPDDTGGSCNWVRCDRWRGPTKCERDDETNDYNCLCKDGWCAFFGSCFKQGSGTCERTTDATCQWRRWCPGGAICEHDGKCVCPQGTCASTGSRCVWPRGWLGYPINGKDCSHLSENAEVDGLSCVCKEGFIRNTANRCIPWPKNEEEAKKDEDNPLGRER